MAREASCKRCDHQVESYKDLSPEDGVNWTVICVRHGRVRVQSLEYASCQDYVSAIEERRERVGPEILARLGNSSPMKVSMGEFDEASQKAIIAAAEELKRGRADK